MNRGRLARGIRHSWRIASNHNGMRAQSWRRVKFAVLPRFTRWVLTTDDGLDFLVASDDTVIGRDLYVGQSHEVGVATMRPVVQLVTSVLGDDPLRGKTFVDVGANIGTTSVAAVLRFGAADAVSIEPAPENLRLLRCNLILNDVDDRVQVVAAAVAAVEGEVELELSPENHGDHRIRTSSEPGRYGEQHWNTVKVPARRLDALLAERQLTPGDVGLLWVDVEGFEADVLESAGAFLGQVPCVIEYVPYFLRRAGGIDRLHQLVGAKFSEVVDLRTERRFAPEALPALAEELGDASWTDLLLVP